MSLLHLESLFEPSSVAVIGASRRPRSIGGVVLRNLLDGGFEGPVLPVHPKYESVAGVLAYPDVAGLPLVPDLAVLCTPAATVPPLLDELGALGTRAAIVLSAGLREQRDDSGKSLTRAALEACGRRRMRMLGPNCVGLLVPGIGLNASFAHVGASPGRLAFVSQSGAMCTAVLDWSRRRGIGFSHFVSLGESADVDLADTIDFIAERRDARALLLYIESVRNPRKFLSAARSAARGIPTLAIKAGRNPEGSRAAASHSGALAASDLAYDAALRRAGILRVESTDELFEAVETLARVREPQGRRLLVVSNGGGPGVLAVDRLIARGGELARLSVTTVEKLDDVLPANWPRANPVDLIGDAPPERYREALRIVAGEEQGDAILVMHAPTAVVSSLEAAQAVIEVAAEVRRPLLACWLGGERLGEARSLLQQAGLPVYDTPDSAIDAFLQLIDYRDLQVSLRQTPPSVPEEFAPESAGARRLIEASLDAGRETLGEVEGRELLASYGIPVIESRIVADAEEAAARAVELGFPVAVKVSSPEILHKSDVGGVALNLESEGAVREAVGAMETRVREKRPDVGELAFVVQPMADRSNAEEVIVGLARDPVFGPLVLFGHGGVAVEQVDDVAVALPPLNLHLASDLVARTRIARLLEGYRDRPPCDRQALLLTLVKISQLAIDLPELIELDVNPLLVGPAGVLALDARARVATAETSGNDHLVICPYPGELEEEVELRNGERVLLRPIRPEDEPAHRELFEALSAQSVYFRFFSMVRGMPHERLSRYTQIDYDREMAFIAVRGGAEPATLGVVRVIFGGRTDQAEFAIVVRSDCQRRGLGALLMDKAIRYCRSRGARRLIGQVLWENHRMRALARKLGFESHSEGGEVLEVTLDLATDAAERGVGLRPGSGG